MKRRNLSLLIFAATIAVLVLFIEGCSSSNSSFPNFRTSATPVASRIEAENKLKNVALNAQFIVPFKAASTEQTFWCTAFFVDQRGYIAVAKHCFTGTNSGLETISVFHGGEQKTVRIVGEVQTLDLAVVSVDEPVSVPVAKFANLSKFFEEKQDYKGSYPVLGGLETNARFVSVHCASQYYLPTLDRVLVGELAEWDRNTSKISFIQPQQNSSGCSGGPILNSDGEVVGLLSESSENLIFGTDAPSVSEAVKLLIAKDLMQKKTSVTETHPEN